LTNNTPLLPIKTNRDLLLFQLPNDQLLVVACDSSGGIGPKPLDKLKVSGHILGKFTARAVLMEVLAAGATPICVVDALGVEAKPTGTEILEGIREEAELAGLDPQLAVTGSTEKNMVVEQTGIGVTVIGTCKKAELSIGGSQPGDIVAAIGLPSVGSEVLTAEKEGKIAETTDLLKLRKLVFIHEIIPVGSTGVLHELQTLAEGARLNYEIVNQTVVDLRKSAGPSTVLLTTLKKADLNSLQQAITKPLTIIATIHKEPGYRTILKPSSALIIWKSNLWKTGMS
jgi:selenophosphate synthetase-related protein